METERLVLRPWADRHREAFAAMCSDAAVMQHLLPLATREASDGWIERQIAHHAQHGFCFWAVETKQDGALVGAIGLLHVSYQAAFTPAVEIGWRLSRASWGRGYAAEAAAASVRYGFETLGLPEIVANTSPDNTKSRRVMERLGMVRDPADDFEHPMVPEGNPLRRQVLYRLGRERWATRSAR